MSNKEVDKVRNHAAKGKEEKSRESPSNSTSEFSDVQTALDSRLDEATRQSIGSLSPKRVGESYRTSSRSPKDGKYRSSRRLSPRRSPREKNKDKKSSKRTSERLANPPLHQDRHSYSEAEGSYDELSHDRRHDYHSSRKKSSRTNKSAHELSPHKRNGDGEGDSSDIHHHHHHHHHRSRKSSRPLIEKGSSERVSSKSPHRRGSHGHRSSRRRISDPKDDPESPKPVGRHARASPHRKNYGDGEDLDVSPIGKPPLVKGKASRKLDLLYGIDDEDAKAKEKARRGHSERHINPGVEHVNSSNSAALSTLYGDASDADAKAKAKASKGGVVVSPSMATTSSKSNTTVTTLYGNHDNDAKLKAKASCRSSPLASPGVESISLFSKESSAISTLYSSTADANAKARAGKGGLMIASMPGVESVHHDGSLASAADTLYGRDAEIKAKAKAGSSGVVSKIGLAGAVTSESLENTSHTSRESTGSAGSLPSAHVHPRRKVNVGASEAMEGFSMPNDPNATTEYVVHENKKRKDRRILLVFLFLLLLIGAGVAVWYFLFRNGDINSDNAQIQSSDVLDPTSTPSFSGAASLMPVGLRVSSIPSSFPSNQPSKQLLYERPSESDCEAIANNQTIAGREQMEYANFGLDLEVVLVDNITMTEPLLEELMKAIQEKILPSLAGCSIVLDRFLEAWRFVIFDAFVKGSVQQEESCIDEAMVEQNCHRVFAELALFLKGSVRFLDIIRLISDEQENFANNLGLSDSFLVVKMIGAKGLTPTASPTVMPSGLPSSPPSELPTEEPSVNPSSISSTPPTMVPSIELTDSPTLVASIAPSLTPSTGAPSLTQSTGMPSWSPSLQPTEFPTESPSSMPTKTLTKNPTPGPTRNPTPRPTVRPTPPPTRLPTVSPATSSPSLPPTSRPSLAPSAMPSRNPTAAPSSRPSATVNFWAICGRQGRCREANSLQNVIWNRYGGQVIGTEIAVRCCSDTPLPGFRIMRSMLSGTLCPYAASEVAGVCYNSATWSEAKALCSSVGARLCTKFELENDCTTNSGCWHDYRFAWSSTN